MLTSDLIAILPEIILTVAGIMVILVGAFFEKTGDRISGFFAYAGLIAAGLSISLQWGHAATAFGGIILIDAFSIVFHLVFLVIGLLVLLSASQYLSREKLAAAEFYALILFGTVGMGVMAAAN